MSLPPTVPFIGWAWDDLVFLALAGVLLGGAMMMVLSRNIIRSGLFMVFSFLGLAGIYALAGATVVAAAQVLVYVGAISVLILFAVMLTQSKSGPARLVFQKQAGIAAVAAFVMLVLLVGTVLYSAWPAQQATPTRAVAREVALSIFNENLFAFEVVSLLLLAAVVGGIFLARKDDTPEENEQP